jgi:L-asparaginase
MKKTNKVLLIYTGGTIGMGKNPLTGALEPLDFNNVVANVPEFKYITSDIDTYQFNPPIDSSDMTPQLWAELVTIISTRYDDYDGFIILHGTDTMAYTASALSFMLENLTKPVVLTGSQLPIGQLRTDGKENLLTSIELAGMTDSKGYPIVPEVCIYFNGRLIRGNRSTKQNADGFNAFESFNYPHLCDVGVNMSFHRHHILKPDYTKPMVPHTTMDPNVIVFSLFPGIQENVVRHVLDAPELKGIVTRSFGSGNAPQKSWIKQLLKEAAQRGITIVNISQCLKGTVEMARYDTGYHLKDAGVISGLDCTVEAAVTKLMYLHGRYDDPEIIREKMSQSIAGEMTCAKREA